MATVEKTPAIDPEVLADLEAVCNTKGIVRDPAVHHRVCNEITVFLAAQGWNVGGVVPSPILGGDGNREFFIEAERG